MTGAEHKQAWLPPPLVPAEVDLRAPHILRTARAGGGHRRRVPHGALRSSALTHGEWRIRRFVEKLGGQEVAAAMRVACDRWPSDDDRACRYFCGICWAKIREAGG